MTEPISAASLRKALGHFATGVTVITAAGADGQPVGLTASSFNSVSLDPPLVLWSLGRVAGTMAGFATCSHFAIHVLQADQRALAERFSKRMPDRFEGIAWKAGLGGAPVLHEAATVFECANVRQHIEGDHVVFIGAVARLRTTAHAQPLLYHGGRFYTELPMGAEPAAAKLEAPPAPFIEGYLGYLLGQANHAVYKGFEADLREAGLSHIEWRVLTVLHSAQTLSVTQLTSAVLSKQPTVTKLAQGMEINGLLQLLPDPTDPRKVSVRATKAGLALAAQLNARAQAREDWQLKHLSGKEQADLKRLLAKLLAKT